MNKPETTDLDLKAIRSVPNSVITAMRRIFPEQSSNGDLLSAFVYVFTDGGCEISPKAMKLVESYKLNDKNQKILQKLNNIERLLLEQNK